MIIDAAIQWVDEKVYFFVGDSFYGYDLSSGTPKLDRIEGIVRPIVPEWSGQKMFSSDIDAVVLGRNGRAFFFRGDQYLAYQVGQGVEADFPKQYATHWPGITFESGVDTAIYWNNSKAYFFKGEWYVRYDRDRDHVDPGYPRLIRDDWPGLFESNIKVAFAVGDTKAYFFKDDMCIRWDMVQNSVDPGYPKQITEEWPTPSEFLPSESKWFLNGYVGPSTLSENNQVVAFIDGSAAFGALANAIRSAQNANHFIYLIGWEIQYDNFNLLDDGSGQNTHMDELLKQADTRGVQIRAMFPRVPREYSLSGGGSGGGSGHSEPAETPYLNAKAVDFINSLNGGAAIHDNRFMRFVGTHHQKIWIVNGSEGLVAFSGGMDIDGNRLTTVHDVQCMFSGPAAFDHYLTFVMRWQDNPASKSLKSINYSLAVPSAFGDKRVQLGFTYGNAQGHSGLDDEPGDEPANGYSFAPSGDKSLQALVYNAIEKARKFIYIEEQYLVDVQTSQRLLAALPFIEKLVILIPPTKFVNPKELFQGWKRRKAFLEPLLLDAPDKVTVCASVEPKGIHSKLWIFDDEFALIGSANINRRGFTHDSEQIAGIFHNSRTGNWVHQLRMELWAKHLGIQSAELVDPISSFSKWTNLPPTASIAPYNLDDGTDDPSEPLFLTDGFWDTVVDPDGS